ncbi:EGF domain-specific O-linked N-acetylglucosamine transferase-like isoform X2 [Amphibalanus amphitrite]|uniref:EGF domain-specific O-linked N-acetylglucosamine transferase-like isoform X2 n=1 Tax=Amphibalanus amphitrite TaxID=1232801 RepID=UPI001C90F814|nr:EGF domain-specific O-linked N-acetylglucosamine transferase-like isoform X2 [Amphibalanus amphitrite]
MIYSMTAVSLFIFLIAISIQCKGNIVSELALPPEHVPFYVNSHQRFSDGCRRNGSCQLKPYLDQGLCWGYEENCPIFKSYLVPECDGKSKGWAATKTSQLEMYYEQADFGYIKRRMKTMFPLCSPIDSSLDASALNCSSKMEFCRGRNIRLDFRELTKRRGELLRYKMDVLKPGQMAGHCRVDRDRLSSELEFMSALQSWSPEIQHLTQAERPLTGRPECDRVVTTPTYIMKLDASVSMYHHFCDFFNLYASQHLNDSMDGDHPGSFHRDKQILIWENVPYRSAFAPMFQVFSSRPIWSLNDVIGQRVCFKDVVFPLPPRMIFGLFYNTPLVPGCRQSGLFHAFQRHVLHRLGLPLRRTVADDTVRVVWISRQSRHRRRSHTPPRSWTRCGWCPAQTCWSVCTAPGSPTCSCCPTGVPCSSSITARTPTATATWRGSEGCPTPHGRNPSSSRRRTRASTRSWAPTRSLPITLWTWQRQYAWCCTRWRRSAPTRGTGAPGRPTRRSSGPPGTSCDWSVTSAWSDVQ